MLKHSYISTCTTNNSHSGQIPSAVSIKRGVSPALSSSSSLISTDNDNDSSGSSLISVGSSVFSSSSSTTSTAFPFEEYKSSSKSSVCIRKLDGVRISRTPTRTPSAISLSETSNAVPLRVYANDLRPDIQYKTVGVTETTTCKEVITELLAKCRVCFKDPRLFNLAMEVDIRGPNGNSTHASIQLEDSATPLLLQECYPKGQAKFCLQMQSGHLVKVFDGSNSIGWEYKSIMISEKTTAAELIDILFLYVVKNLSDTKYYTLHIEVDGWRRILDWYEPVIPAQNVASRWGKSKLILICHDYDIRHSRSLMLGSSSTSTAAIYDNSFHTRANLTSRPTKDCDHNLHLNSSGESTTSTLSPMSLRRNWKEERRRRSKSLSERESQSQKHNQSYAFSTFRDPVKMQLQGTSLATGSGSNLPQLKSYRCYQTKFIQPQPQPAQQKQQQPSLTRSVVAEFAKLNTRFGKYELSEAFFV